MALKDIENWTRSRLEEEAVRLGIADGHLRTRADLLRSIVRKVSLAPLRRGRALLARSLPNRDEFKSNLKVADALLPDPFRPLLSRFTELVGLADAPAELDLASSPPSRQPAQEPGPAVEGPHPSLDRPQAEKQSQAEDQVQARGQSKAEGQIPGREARQRGDIAANAGPVVPEPQSPEPAVPVAARPVGKSTTGDEVESNVRRFLAEPARTLDMARLLAHQGHRGRALGIYEQLIAHSRHDPVLRREASIVGEGGDMAGLPEPGQVVEPADRVQGGDDTLSWGARDGTHIRLNYRVSQAGKRRAEAVLGSRGQLALRLVVVGPGGRAAVRSEIEEQGLSSDEGSFDVGPLDGQVRCVVALGLRQGGQFVSIVHGPVPT